MITINEDTLAVELVVRIFSDKIHYPYLKEIPYNAKEFKEEVKKYKKLIIKHKINKNVEKLCKIFRAKYPRKIFC